MGKETMMAIPSHFYGIAVRCKSGSGIETADCELDQLDAVRLLFQHPTEGGVYNMEFVYVPKWLIRG